MEKLICGLVILLVGCASYAVPANIDIKNINLNDIQQQLPPEFANANQTLQNAKVLKNFPLS